MSIQILKSPIAGHSDAGLFNLPPTFDTTKFAAEWVEEGQVAFKRQRQVIPQANATADGWEVWRLKQKDAPTVVCASGNKKFTLMCRSRKVQDQVNALCGNVSKKFIQNEVKGKTVAGNIKEDSGMLTNEQLSSARTESFQEELGDTNLNPVAVESHEVTAAVET